MKNSIKIRWKYSKLEDKIILFLILKQIRE